LLIPPDLLAVESSDSFDFWHEATCRNFSLSQTWRPSSGAFRSSISSRKFGALTLSDVSASSLECITLDRGAADIRKDPRDQFMLYLVTEGEVQLSQEDRQAHARTGDLFLYDQTRPFRLEFPPSYRAIMVNIPRPLLEARIADARRMTALRVAGASNLGALSGSIVRQLIQFDEPMKDATTGRLSESLLDILGTTFDAQSTQTRLIHATDHRLLAQVKRYILANLHDTTLNLDTIASAQNTAPRTLNRMFATEGTTPIRWLWQQRLTASYQALSEGHVGSVTEAALSFGFSDVSHFSRAFKRAFGTSPQEIKRTV
jgi:AraC-like DNA-binding protein